MIPDFEKWFSRIKFSKSAYFAKDLKPLLDQCWTAANPPKKLTRSEAQRRYQFGVVYKTIGDELGYDVDEVHQELSKMFLSYEKNGSTFVKSTTKLNTKEMEEYLEQVRRFASMELSIFIQLPNEESL